MALTKADLKARKKAELEKEQAEFEEKKEKEKIYKEKKEKEKKAALETKPKTEATQKTESQTEVTQNKTANNAAGKAQQFSTIANKPAYFSAKAISSEAEKNYNKLPISPVQRGKQAVGENIARSAGVKQETLDNIKAEAIPKFGKDVFSESVDSGVANLISNTVGGLDFLSKLTPAGYVTNKLYGDEQNPLSKVNESLQQWKQKEAAEAMEAAEKTGKGKSAEISSQIITTVTEAIPDIVLSLATMGGSKAVTAAGKGAKALTSAKTFLPAVKQAAVSTVKNPSFWLNFEQMLYPEYEAAIASGASEDEANITALLSAFGQASIESGSGYQKLPDAGANSVRKAVFDYVKSAVEEGNEEVVQSIVSGITQKIVFDHDKNLVSTTSGEDAVFNMADAFDEWLLGTLAGGIMSAPGGLLNTSNTMSAQQNVSTGELTFTPPTAPITEIPSIAENNIPKVETNVSTEVPVTPVQPPIIETENVTPKAQNEQEGAFANVGEYVGTERQNNVAETPGKTLETLKEQFDKGEISEEEYLAKTYENLSKYFEERKNANAQVNSTNDLVEPANAKPRAQENIPQEMVAPENRAVEVTPKKANVKAEVEEGNAQNGAQGDGGFGENTVGAAQSKNTFYKALNEFGAQPLRKEQIAKDNYFEVPNQIAPGVAMSEDIGYMAGSELGDNDYMDDVIQHPEKYAHQINTDAESMQRAIDDIKNNGLDETYGVWRDKIDHNKMIEKDDITKAAMTALFYQNKAKTETDPQKKAEYRKKSLDIKTDINYAATKGGQLLQSLQVLQKLVDTNGINLKEDGEYMANRLVEKLNKDRKGKGKEIVFNQDLVDKAVAAAGTDAEGKAWDEVYKDLANQTSTSFWQRFNNYRYWCMLSNPRTHIRNVVSNMSMAIVNGVKDATKFPVEAAFNAYAKGQTKRAKKVDDRISQLIASGKTNDAKKLENKAEKLHRFDNAQQKTTAIYYPKDYIFAIKDFDNAKKIFDASGKYDSNTNNFIREHKTNQNSDPITTYLSKKIEGNNKFSKGIKTVLEHGAFGSVMDFNSWLLSDVEDGSFKSLIYAHELAQRMRANGITAETATNPENIAKMDKIRAEAFAEALYNTFNEDSKLADSIKNFSNKSVPGYLISETLLPFKKVPINILKTSIDYSPIGVFKGIGEMAKVMRNPTSSDPGKAINDIAKGLTGLELMVLGAFLRSIGKITNGLSDDDDEKKFQKLLGEQAFAIKFDDGSSYSMEWLGSSVMPLFSGALAYDTWNGELKNKVNSENFASVAASGLAGTLASIANPMIEMSMLSNIEYLLTNQYNDIEEAVVDVLGDYANQFVPQVLNAITKVTDNTKRNAYYVDKTDNIPDIIQGPYQTAISKIPGASKNLSAQVDAWGRIKTHSDRDTKLGWAFDALISPGTYKKDKTTEEDKMIAQLVADTGNTNLYPSGPSQKYVTVDNVKYPLSAKEYEQMSIEKGEAQRELISQLIPDDTYKALSLEDKEKTVKGIYEYAGALSKEGVHGYELPKEWQKAQEAKKDGLAEGTYISLKSALGTKEKDIDKMRYLIADKGTTNEEKVVAMEYLTDINMDKYKKFSSDPKDIIKARTIYLEEKAKGGDGTNARIIDRMIKDKGTSAKEDVAFMENVLDMNMSKYKSATTKATEQLKLYKLVSDTSEKKEADIKSLVKDGYSAAEALAKYNVSSGNKKYENGEFKNFGKNQKPKAEKLKKKGYSTDLISKAANAVTSFGDYGTSKNYSTYVKMLEAVGITDKKFQKDFYNVYVAG